MDNSTNPTNASLQDSMCNDATFRGGTLHVFFLLSIFIIVVLSYLSKRDSKRNRQLVGNPDQSGNLVQRFFSLIYPIDLFDNHDRLPHCLAIGSASGIIMDLIFGQFKSYFPGVTIPIWATILAGTLVTVEISIAFFPLFWCISSKSQIFAKGIGFMYVTAWFVLQTLFLNSCGSVEEYLVPQRLPMIFCLGLLALYFLGKFIMGVNQWYKGTTPTKKERLHKTHQAVYVRNLFNKQKEIEYSGWRGLIFKIYKPLPGFTYPNRVILPCFVSLIGIWHMAFIIIPGGLTLKPTIKNFIKYLLIAKKDVLPQVNNLTEQMNQIDSGLTASWWIATPLALLVMVAHIFGILVKYRTDLLSLRSGKYKLPQSVTLTSTDKVVSSLKYIGFQVSLMVFGYMATQVLLFLVLLAPTTYVLLCIWDVDKFFVFGFLKFFLPAAIVGSTVMLSQTFVTMLVFVPDKLKPADKDKPLAVKHRIFFLIFSYVTMFLNMLFGMVFSGMRVGIAIVGVILNLSRMDRPIWVSGGGDQDMVQILYVGNVLTENAHSNPILVMFCHLMVFDILKPRQKQLGAHENHSKAHLVMNELKQGDVESPKREKESLHLLRYFRWHLAYTLIKNPSLIELRKHSAIVHDPDAVLKNHEGNNIDTKLLPHLVQVLKRQEKHLKMTDSDTLPTKENPSLNSVDLNSIGLKSLTATEFAEGDRVPQSEAPLPPSKMPLSQDTTQPAVQPQPPSYNNDPTLFGSGSESNA